MRALRFGLVPAAVLLGLMLFSQPSEAACDPLSLCSCTASASGVSFGSYSPLSGSPTDSVGMVTVSCNLVVAIPGSYVISLSSGSSGTFAARTLAGSGANLLYNLYTSAARTQIWGDGTGASQTVTGTFVALLSDTQSFNIYGRIPASQNVAAGGYADTIIVTVAY